MNLDHLNDLPPYVPTPVFDTCLFIGGPRDGQRGKILYGEKVIEPTVTNTPERIYYIRDEIRVDGAILSFWRYGAMSRNEALAKLFQGYLP